MVMAGDARWFLMLFVTRFFWCVITLLRHHILRFYSGLLTQALFYVNESDPVKVFQRKMDAVAQRRIPVTLSQILFFGPSVLRRSALDWIFIPASYLRFIEIHHIIFVLPERLLPITESFDTLCKTASYLLECCVFLHALPNKQMDMTDSECAPIDYVVRPSLPAAGRGQAQSESLSEVQSM